MKTPANPFTIHVIKPQDVIPYVAPRRPSRVYRVRPRMAETRTRTGHGMVQTSRVLVRAVTQLCRMLVGAGVGVVQGLRCLYRIARMALVRVYHRAGVSHRPVVFDVYDRVCLEHPLWSVPGVAVPPLTQSSAAVARSVCRDRV